MSRYKDPNVKGRKFNGSPHLKFKMIKSHPRQKIRQSLRSFMPLENYTVQVKSEKLLP